ARLQWHSKAVIGLMTSRSTYCDPRARAKTTSHFWTPNTSRLSALLVGCIAHYAPFSRLARRAPRRPKKHEVISARTLGPVAVSPQAIDSYKSEPVSLR